MKTIASMEQMVKKMGEQLIPIKQGQLVEANVISVSRNSILLDVLGLCYGMVPEKEMGEAGIQIKTGDKVLAYVLMPESEDGYCILSLKRADRERLAVSLKERFEKKEPTSVQIIEANSGGLIARLGNFEGFLPTSQLSTKHYPKVEDKDKSKILSKLKELVGQTLNVQIISYKEEKPQPKLIFSEKALGDEELIRKASKLKVGEALEGTISGIVDFGLFVNLGDLEGLVHISEVSWDRVADLKSQFRVGDKLQVKVIGIENGRVSLSIKRLLTDPWEKIGKQFKVGEIVEGLITNVTPFGAFVQLPNRLKDTNSTSMIEGLVHVSQLGEEVKDPKQVVSEGKKYKFKIMAVEPENRKIALSLKEAFKKETKKAKTKTTKKKRKA